MIGSSVLIEVIHFCYIATNKIFYYANFDLNSLSCKRKNLKQQLEIYRHNFREYLSIEQLSNQQIQIQVN